MSASGLLARFSAALAIALVPAAALAQPTPPSGAGAAQTAPKPAEPGADPVVAKVGAHTIHMSEVKAATQNLPPNARSLPEQVLYPMLLDRMIDEQLLVIEARRDGLDKNPEVQRQIAAADDQVLERALLTKQIGSQVSDQAVRARYDRDVAGKPGAEEVHARHILVDSEAKAKDIIAQLDKGADFATLAKKDSKDPGAGQGGDLGYFKKDDMVPEFAVVAFSLKPGEISQTPVHTQFGWHVIQVLDRRAASAPSFDQAKAELRQKMVREAIEQVVADARGKVPVEKFNPDGSPMRATDTAMPPLPAK